MSSGPGEPPDRSLRHEGLQPEEVLTPSEREILMAGMAIVCAKRGYAAASIAEVVDLVGLPRETFDKNFVDKEECALAAASLVLAEAAAVVSAVYSEDNSHLQSMIGTMDSMTEALAEQPAFADLMYVQARQISTERMRRYYEAGLLLFVSLLDRLRQYASDDIFLPPTAARGGLGGAEAIARREIAAGRADRLPKLLPDFVYGALVPILGQEEALRYASMAREQLGDEG